MSLESFKYHFRKAFNETSTQQTSTDNSIEKSMNEKSIPLEHEPKVAVIECRPITKIKKNTRAKRESIG